jgi:hypothetical protein
MNAVEQAQGLEFTTKIATIVNLFKSEFPDARADLKPWSNDPDTQGLVDPDSIDIGFHLPGWSRKFQCRSILVQIRLYEDPLDGSRRGIGIEAAGFDHRGKVWRLSTVEDWQVVGESEPTAQIQDKLKHFCREALNILQ